MLASGSWDAERLAARKGSRAVISMLATTDNNVESESLLVLILTLSIVSAQVVALRASCGQVDGRLQRTGTRVGAGVLGAWQGEEGKGRR